MSLERQGFLRLPFDPRVAEWAAAARAATQDILADPGLRAEQLRHGETWFAGINVLPNDTRGAVHGVPLAGPWQALVLDLPHDPAQVSIVYPGYPKQDPNESDAAHRYRANRFAAHVDGLLPEGPEKRRFAREYHAYILGIPLNACAEAPTVVWPGSHHVIGAALREALADASDPGKTDVTEAYHAARRAVFEASDPVPVSVNVGESFLIHRHALHGTSPWQGPPQEKGRMIAFFRPEFPDAQTWLEAD